MKILAYLFAVALGVTTTSGPANAEEPLEDLTPPVITVTPMAGAVDGWYAGTATVFIKATDPGAISSGVRSVFYTMSGATTGTGTIHRTEGGTLTISNSGQTTISIEASDGNDNQAFGGSIIRIDRDRPTAVFAGRLAPSADRVFANGEEVLVQFDCADTQSGVASCTGTQAAGALLDTSVIGDHVLVVTARDRVGNQQQFSTSYKVVSNQFDVTRLPDINGTKTVGQQVSVRPPVYDPAPTTITYQWTRNGVAIPGATGTTYTITADDARAVLRVLATATRSAWVSRTVGSPSYEVAPALISISEDPSLSGEARVGGTLTLRHGAFTPTAAAVSYQWLRDGVLIPTATGRTYFPGAEDIGARISVRVAATAPGHSEAVWVTAPTGAVRGRTLQVSGVPTVSGALRAGSVLTATPPTVTVPGIERERAELPPAAIAYQWLRDGAPIAGATAATYRLAAADVGRRVSVRVTATRPPQEGYEPVVLDSAPGAAVAKATPALAAKAKAKKGGKVKLTVTVSVPGLDPSAPVTVKRGKKVVARGTVNAAGRLVLTLKRQPKGKVKWLVTYAGSAGVTAATVKVSAKVR